MKSYLRFLLLLCMLLFALPKWADSQHRFPEGAGEINIKQRYGAKGDGVTDDSASIQKAIDENKRQFRVLYFPIGTYLVKHKLTYGADIETNRFLTLQGESASKCVIKLADYCPGFSDPAHPQCLLTMFEGGSTGRAFHNFIFDITFDVGAGNSGAIGIQWMQNNTGSMRNVLIRSSDPEQRGAVALDLTKTEPGPGLLKNVTLEGFDYGIVAIPGPFSTTFEHLTLRSQRVAGIRNRWHTLIIRDLKSYGHVPVLVQNEADSAMTTLIDADLQGGKGGSALLNKATLTLRNVKQSGYDNLLPGLKQATRVEYYSHLGQKCGAFPGAVHTLNLPIEETPEVPWDAPEKWQVISAQALKAQDDDTAVIQEALDRAAQEGRTTVSFPGGLAEGEIKFGGTLHVRGNIRRIVGMNAAYRFTDAFAKSALPVFSIETSAPVCVVEQFVCFDYNHASFIMFAHESSSTLVLKDFGFPECQAYRAASAAGKVFIEDIAGTGFVFQKGQHVWMRQINPESQSTMLINDGAILWILGLKTENAGGVTVIKTTNGGCTELLGGMNYTSWDRPSGQDPMFVVEDSSASFTIGDLSFRNDKLYRTVLRERRASQTRELTVSEGDAGGRGDAGMFPLITAFASP
jgi:hypothetical protein